MASLKTTHNASLAASGSAIELVNCGRAARRRDTVKQRITIVKATRYEQGTV